MHSIETFDLTKKFNGFTAVDGLSMQVEEGEVFGLLGPNGAGKTTTISMLCTILKPTSGSAQVNGFDILKNPKDVRKSIGIVFQDPSLDTRLTGRENLKLHGELYGVGEDVLDKRISETIRLVELEARALDLVKTYSGGMKRRLEIARGLIHRPKVLFLDEPTLGLDPQTRIHVWDYIKGLCEKEKITIVLTTHYMEEAEHLCDRVGIVDAGRIVALGNPRELIHQVGGDIVGLKISDASKASLFSNLGFVKKAFASGETVKLLLDDGSEKVPEIFEFASRENIKIESIEVSKPTLNDVFLHYVGREIREEKAGRKENLRLRMQMKGA